MVVLKLTVFRHGSPSYIIQVNAMDSHVKTISPSRSVSNMKHFFSVSITIGVVHNIQEANFHLILCFICKKSLKIPKR